MFPQAKVHVLRRRSYYLSEQQRQQLRWLLVAALSLPIVTVGALLFIFPGALDLDAEGGRKLLERAWQNMKAEPLELTLFVVFGLFGLLQSGYVLLARRRERLRVDELGISYVSPLPELLQVFRPSWKLQWSQIRRARIETSRLSPLLHVIVLDAGLGQRKIAPFQWVVEDETPIGPTGARKWRSLDSEAITGLLQLSPVTQNLANAAIEMDFDTLCSPTSKSFALEENPSTLFALVLFFSFAGYALIDGAFLIQETYAERPFYELYAIAGILLSIVIGIWLLRAQVPRAEGLALSALVGVGFALALYPGALRINAISDANGLQQYMYQLESDRTFKAIDTELPVLHFERDGEYWARFEIGSNHVFELRKGGLGFYQLNMAPVYAAMKEFYRQQ